MRRLVPCLMFVGDQCGRAQDAIDVYVSAFADSRILEVERFGSEDEGERGIKHARVVVAGHELAVMDSPGAHPFTFTPAISLVVELASEDELDAAWATLGTGGAVLMPLQAYDFSPKFGWLQDRFGVTWQLNISDATAHS